MYDFDESSVLSLDEMVLAFRSTLSGLSKLSRVDPPTEAEVEVIVVQGVDSVRKAQGKTDIEVDFTGIDKEDFVNFCLNTPEIMSWIEYFDDLEEYEQDLASKKPIPRREPTHMDRTIDDESVMNQTLGGQHRFKWEQKGLSKDILPRLPFQNVLPFITPPRMKDHPKDLPSHNVSLEWVYGYNAHSSRQNLYYSSRGEMVYPAGNVVVCQNVAAHTQSYFNVHTDLVLAVKLYHVGDGNTIVASSEAGVRPAVHIWDCESKTLISTLKGFHRNGVLNLDFSPDHEKLATIGMDTYQSIAVYIWRTREQIFAARTTFEKVYDLRFLADDLIASCGVDHVYFWKQSKPYGYKRYRGLFGSAIKPETLVSCAIVGNTVVTGSISGMIHVWEGRNLISSKKAHTGAINAMFVVDQGDEKGLVTACSMGKIQVWNSKLEVGATFNAAALGSIDANCTSVCWSLLQSKILIGFKTCEIYEMDATDGRNAHSASVVAGHYNPLVAGLSTHPMNPNLFCTVGNDKTVRIFDSDLHKQLRVSLLDTTAHCCAFSPNGQMILIGLGNGIVGKEERKEGTYLVLNEADLTLLRESRDSKFLLTDCKFSPNGESMALSSLDGSVYVYNTKEFSAKAKCRGHTGQVKHIDFSEDSQFLMTNDDNGELLFWDADKGDLQIPKAMKEVQWSSNNCVYSYGTQGVWGPYADGLLANGTAKSNAQDLLACVDNFGRLRVYNFPVVKEDSNFILLSGHSADVRNVRFSCDDQTLFSSGGTDGSIFQWKLTLPETQDYGEIKKDESIKDAMPVEMNFEGKTLERNKNFENVINDRPEAICEMEEGLVDVNFLLPWQRTIVAPSRVPMEDHSEPPDELVLEFVYGMASDISREPLMYAPNGDALFFVAAVAVIMNQRTRTQVFYQEHASTITAMAVLKCEDDSIPQVVATGDQGEMASIRIWDPANLQTIVIIEGFHRRAISHLKFSPNGCLLLSVGQDKFHSIAIYDWQSGQIVSHTNGILSKSFFVGFNPSGTQIIQCGNDIIRFWEVKGRNIQFQDALLGKRAKLQAFLTAGWIGNNAVVGTVDGSLYRFGGRQLDAAVVGHAKAINCISSSNDGICTSSMDGYVKIWTRMLECRLVIDMKVLRSLSPNARCVSWDFNLGRILIATASAEIFEVSSGDGDNMHGGPLLEGHGGEELWGLANNPVKDEFCTVGDDAVLRVWDIFTHSSVATVPLELQARCVCYSPDGRRVAIGFGSSSLVAGNSKQYDGKWIVMDTEDFQVVHEARDSVKWITEIKYSPNSDLIAVGSYDNKIYIYNIHNGYGLNAVISQHQSFIVSFDFSEDSAWLQSNCGGFELNFFEADTGLYIPAASRLRDQTWSSHNCTMGWPVQGIWPPQRDSTEVTCSECNLFRGTDGVIAATGDSYGRLSLFRYPTTSVFACSKKYRGSSNPVTRMRFVAGDSLLVTLSGVDKAIFQWAHKRDRAKDVAHNLSERKNELVEEAEDVEKFFGLTGADESLPDMGELTNMVQTRPWIASVVAPTNPKPNVDTPPQARLEKSHIFGLQTNVTRGSVRFNSGGDIIYPASRYVCVYNKKKNGQLHYEGHTNEISCVGVSRDGTLAASVEKVNRCCIHIWDANNGELIKILPQLHRRGVSFIQFSADRRKMVSVGQDQDHSIALWESPTGTWADGRLLAWGKGDVAPTLFVSFYDKSPNGFILASGGRFHQKFWRVNGRCLNAVYAEYDAKQKIGTLLCGSSVGTNFVSGSTGGHLFLWRGRKLDRIVRAHELGVSCVWACDQGMVTTSKDGMVKLWSLELEHLRSFMLQDADVPPVIPCIRSLDVSLSLDGKVITRILVATSGGEIYEISAKSGNTCLVHESHYSGELWGLCTHPTNPDLFATCGDDKTIRIWSISARRLLRKAVIDSTARCISWSKDGMNILVGMGGSSDGKRQRKDGAFLILDSNNLRPLFEGRDSRHWLQDVKFSPDGRSFAVGSMDHKIYIYSRETYRLKGTCDRHNSYIKGFDYSEDSTYIQSDSGDFEHLYFEAEDGEYFAQGSQLKDIEWSDWACQFGWPVQGAWPYFEEVTQGTSFEPTSVHRSPDSSFLAVGDTGGGVKIFNYPCINKSAKPVEQANAHVKEVSKVKFSCDGRYIISLGKLDRTIVMWKVLPEKLRHQEPEEESKSSKK
jgi:microtubule-associated protein-like 6